MSQTADLFGGLPASDRTEDAVAPVAVPTSSSPSLADYVLGEKLGEGGNAAVYRATEKQTGRTVAVKLIHKRLITDPRFFGRFAREVRATTTLVHEHICRVFASGETDGELWLAMELIDGGSLNDLLHTRGAVPPQVAVLLIDALLAALDVAHAHRILHRDIKPHNIMITRDGVLKLVDFGIARGEGDAKVTETGFLVGTPAYMSPEQVTGRDIDHRSDLYAAGVVLYELLTGENPRTRYAPSTAMLKIATEPLPALSDLDDTTLPSLDSVTASLLQRDPDRRPATAEAARRELATLVRWVRERHPTLLRDWLQDPTTTTTALREELFALHAAWGHAHAERGLAARPAAVLAFARALRFRDDAAVRARLERLCLEGTFQVGTPPPRVAEALRDAEAHPGNAALWRRLADIARAEGHLPLAARGLRRWLSFKHDQSAALQLRRLLGDGDGPLALEGLPTRELVSATPPGGVQPVTVTSTTPPPLPPSMAPPAAPPQPLARRSVTAETRGGLVLGVGRDDEAPARGPLLLAAGLGVALLFVLGASRLVRSEVADTKRVLSDNIAHVGIVEEHDVERRAENLLLDARTALAGRRANDAVMLCTELLNMPTLSGLHRRQALWVRGNAWELLDNRLAARRDYLAFLDIAPVTDERYADARERVTRLGAP
jgi:tRNA A-37 threonylcarbamoyl transferase component Bud32